jgi:hypothetical protein
VSAPDSETLRGWLDHGVLGPLVSIRFADEPGRPRFVCKINGESVERVAKIECDDSASVATAHLFAAAPEVAEEVLLLRERTEKAEAERDAMLAAVREYIAADDAWGAAVDRCGASTEPRRVKRARKRLSDLSREGGR